MRRLIPTLALVHALLACGCGGSGGGSGASVANPPPPAAVAPPPASTPVPDPSPVCETRDVYTLCVTVQNPSVSPATLEHMKDVFFGVYPRLADRFNHAAPLSVYFVIGPSPYIAGASGNSVTYQAEWMSLHPQDYDVVVHEVMHIVQNYTTSPGWLTEGIADYVRYHYGVNNEADGWHMQRPAAGSSYTDGYGVTARFLVWVEERHDLDLVDALNAALHGGSYETGMWVTLTGKSVDELWGEYVADPALDEPDA